MVPVFRLPCERYDIKIPRNVIDHLTSMKKRKEGISAQLKRTKRDAKLIAFGSTDGFRLRLPQLIRSPTRRIFRWYYSLFIDSKFNFFAKSKSLLFLRRLQICINLLI